MIRNLGVNFYRFSLSWTRILPNGYSNQINRAGVEYYNRLIDNLLLNGIEPMVTLYHWDLPQIFSQLGGWSNPAMVQYFASYSRIAFELFGDRVKTWLTFNEPRLICQMYKGLVGNLSATFPFGVVEYMCGHNILKAHAEAYHIYNREFKLQQNGRVSLALDLIWSESASEKPEDKAAAEQRRQFEVSSRSNFIFKKFEILVWHIRPSDFSLRLPKNSERTCCQPQSFGRFPTFTIAEVFLGRKTGH